MANHVESALFIFVATLSEFPMILEGMQIPISGCLYIDFLMKGSFFSYRYIQKWRKNKTLCNIGKGWKKPFPHLISQMTKSSKNLSKLNSYVLHDLKYKVIAFLNQYLRLVFFFTKKKTSIFDFCRK